MSKSTGARTKRPAARWEDLSQDRPAAGASKKLSPAGAKIVAAFQEAIEAMQSGEPREKHLPVRSDTMDFAPRTYGSDDVRRVRGLLDMSQAVFARFLGVDPNTVRSWEQGSRPPSPIARRFMDEIESDPGYWRRRVAQGRNRAEAEKTTG
jgi:putative transcriptional regulator